MEKANKTENTISVVLSDVDGTLYAHGASSVSLPVQAATRSLRSNGITLLPVTARPSALMRELVTPLDLRDDLAVLDGGATIAHATSEQVVWSRWIDPEIVKNIARNIGPLSTVLCCTVEFNPMNWEQVRETLERDNSFKASVPSVFSVFSPDQSNALLQRLAAIPHIKHTNPQPYENHPMLQCVQISSALVDKQYGAKHMLELLGHSNSPTLAIGDSDSDLPLLAMADVKVAMGNASEELKDMADYVTQSVYDDGFVTAMCKYGLLD